MQMALTISMDKIRENSLILSCFILRIKSCKEM